LPNVGCVSVCPIVDSRYALVAAPPDAGILNSVPSGKSAT
jgi:hypothetical protein